MSPVDSSLALFICAFVFRYLRLVVSCLAFASHRSIGPLDEETCSLTSLDVTVIIPTLEGDSPEIRETVASVLANNPFQIILVTIEKNFSRALQLAASFDSKRISVSSNPQANKRFQMLKGLEAITTDLTVFSDDDVYWKPKTLAWLLSPFEDPVVGGTGTCQRLKRATAPSLSQRFWNFYAALYLERRNFDCASCNAVDGGVPCLSGRTAMYRTHILKEQDFQFEFRNEKWRGSKLNHADDDNFLTRWLVSNGWKLKLQYSEECEVETTLADDHKFILQCLRWSRSNWRSNLTSLFDEKHVWRLQPWSTYSVFLTTITAWALPWDILLVHLLQRATAEQTAERRLQLLGLYLCWWLSARLAKLTGHFYRHPTDLILLPCSIFFGYFHCMFIKTWALCTLSQTTWGSRRDADVDDAYRMASPPEYSVSCSTGRHMPAKMELEALSHPPLHRSTSNRSVTTPSSA